MKNRQTSFSQARSFHYARNLVFFLLLVVGGIVFFYWQIGLSVQKMAEKQVMLQNRALVQAGAGFLNQFFRSVQNEFVILAQVNSVQKLEEEGTRKLFRVLAGNLFEANGFLTDVVRVDKEGISRIAVNVENDHADSGVSLADRDYFLWAKTGAKTGEVYFSQPMVGRGGLFKNQWGVVMATPVFDEGEFNGLIFLSVSIDNLIKKYILPLAYMDEVRVVLASQSRRVVASMVPAEIGINLEELFIQGDFQKIAADLSKNSSAGSLIRWCYTAEGGREKMITSYSPVAVGEQQWLFLVSVPYKSVIDNVSFLRLFQTLALFLVLLAILLASIFFIFILRFVERKSFLDGYRHGQNGVVKIRKG